MSGRNWRNVRVSEHSMGNLKCGLASSLGLSPVFVREHDSECSAVEPRSKQELFAARQCQKTTSPFVLSAPAEFRRQRGDGSPLTLSARADDLRVRARCRGLTRTCT